ncbi:MAG: hypothetical protein [Circular genetic element sp.]|nr:MAG: hypothetical protein [Circular genetic element sp.]
MPKKKAVFGQLTLTGEVAVDWMKAGTEVTIGKVEIGPIDAFPEYNIPEWANERSGDIALIHPANKYDNPILVTQRSILRVLEIWCVDMENEGCETAIEKNNGCQKGVLIIGDNPPSFRFDRDEEKGKFAPYEMTKL